MYYKTKLFIILLTGLISSSAFSAADNIFSVAAWPSNVSACEGSDIFSIASNGSCRIKTLLTERYLAVTVVHASDEATLAQVRVDETRNLGYPSTLLESLSGLGSSGLMGVESWSRAELLASLVIGKDRFSVDNEVLVEDGLAFFSKSYEYYKDGLLALVFASSIKYTVIHYDTSVEVASPAHKAQDILNEFSAEGAKVVILIDKKKLSDEVPQLPEKKQKSAKCIIS